MKRLTQYLNSAFVEAANKLRPKRAKHRIIAYVESYDDVSFWRTVFDGFENDKYHFEVMLPARRKLTKGKKQAMMNLLGESVGRNMIACVDADYDYLMQGATATSRRLIESPYILHTYAYAIENLKCYAESLRQVCVQSTLNDMNVMDIPEFMKLYSKICYPLFAWNILLYRKHDLSTMSMQRFCEIVRLTSFNIENPALSLKQLGSRVTHNMELLAKNHPHMLAEYEDLAKNELPRLGIVPEECYFYIQGHHIMESVTMKILTPVCNALRREREEEIKRLAEHHTQFRNELTCYERSILPVDVVLRKQAGFKESPVYKKLEKDIREFLKRVK